MEKVTRVAGVLKFVSETAATHKNCAAALGPTRAKSATDARSILRPKKLRTNSKFVQIPLLSFLFWIQIFIFHKTCLGVRSVNLGPPHFRGGGRCRARFNPAPTRPRRPSRRWLCAPAFLPFGWNDATDFMGGFSAMVSFFFPLTIQQASKIRTS